MQHTNTLYYLNCTQVVKNKLSKKENNQIFSNHFKSKQMRKFYLCFLMLMLVSVYASSQTKSIMGNVTDESGNAVPFALVKIKNTKTGAAADAKGSFVIQANTGATLVVSATGYAAKEVVVGNDNIINVEMSSTS